MAERLEQERVGVRLEERLCEAAIRGSVTSLGEILEEDSLILDRVVVGSFLNPSPLHVAVSRGHTHFVKELLLSNSELAEVLDSQQQSALHLAAAKGYLEIARELTKVSPDMCLARDRDGLNPVHVAAIKGHVEVLEELVRVNPHAARVRVDNGETVLHLCVKHNQLKTLEKLLEMIGALELVNAKDDGGNTLLHLAVADKKFEIIKHVLMNSEVEVNATNANGHTAMDLLLRAQSTEREPEEVDRQIKEEDLNRQIEDFLRDVKAKRANDLVHGDWLTEKRAALMVVASLIATMAFQAGVNPPGGVWQDNSNGHRAGEAVMAYNYPDSYPYFLRSNTIGFVASLSTILLLISDLPFKKRAFMWILVVIMWLTITSMAFTYAFSIVVVTPKKDREALSRTIVVAVIVWCGVMAVLLLVHTGRLLANVLEEQQSRNEAKKRIFLFRYGSSVAGQPQPSQNLGYGNQPNEA
ncbi:Ankyrin repeat-containing protein [Actinidia chinensis var. chinensis]|uniref:Ankyrin repeat-containing protein n=1 Tax=Actinidia chinensis var. chinensis TaxID=1590841 RepID=A0A2R6R255_ACTCC|nr:Ankyrin repeat-containing protein [Actinidia chinensis var. chinensis]